MMIQPPDLIGRFSSVDETDGYDFVGRLDIMSSLSFFQDYKRQTFRLMRPEKGGRLADIGCGTGEDAREMTNLVGESGLITGFDVSETMISEARKRHGDSNACLSFVQASADKLDSCDHFFDAVRADRVFLHLPSPQDALREAIRVTRPGGRIVISEPDMRSLWITTRFPDVADAVFLGIAHSILHPMVARELYHLFRDMRLEDVSLELRPLVYSDPELGERILNFSIVAQTLVDEGRLSREAVREFLTDLDERKCAGRFLGGLTLFIVSATTPMANL